MSAVDLTKAREAFVNAGCNGCVALVDYLGTDEGSRVTSITLYLEPSSDAERELAELPDKMFIKRVQVGSPKQSIAKLLESVANDLPQVVDETVRESLALFDRACGEYVRFGTGRPLTRSELEEILGASVSDEMFSIVGNDPRLIRCRRGVTH